MACAAFATVVALAVLTPPANAVERYRKAAVDSSGALVVEVEDDRPMVVTKAPGQAGFDQIRIAPNKRAVGWLDLFENPNTSYPIPLQLVVRSGGKARTYTGSGLPVWRWRFRDGGKHVAFAQETVHGGMGVHYELREVASGKIVAIYEPDVDADGRAKPGQKPPKWVRELDKGR
jgi:hypothetical protein